MASAGCVCRDVLWEPGALCGCAHVEVRALLQFHAGGTKNNGRHQHRKSCLGFNGEPHGFVVLFLFSGPKITPIWLFPPKPSRIGTQPIGAGLLAQNSVLPFYGHNLVSPKIKKGGYGPRQDAVGWFHMTGCPVTCSRQATAGPEKRKKPSGQKVMTILGSKKQSPNRYLRW